MRRPLWIALVAGGTALLLALGVTSFVLMLQAKAAADPARLVSAYLTQVRDGHIEAAMRMEGRKPDASEPLLTDAVYAKATERLSAFRILRVRTSGDRALVDVQTTAGGASARSSLELASEGWTPGALLGVVAWRLKPVELSMIDLHVGAPGSIAAIRAHHTGLRQEGADLIIATKDSPGRAAQRLHPFHLLCTVAGVPDAGTGHGAGSCQHHERPGIRPGTRRTVHALDPLNNAALGRR